jgi:hypothetical protein
METAQPLPQLGYETSTRFCPFVEWIRALWRSLDPSSQPSGNMDTVPTERASWPPMLNTRNFPWASGVQRKDIPVRDALWPLHPEE